MKRFDPGYERLLDAAADAPATLRLVASARPSTRASASACARPASSRRPTLRPPTATRSRRTTAAQVATAVGIDDPRHVRPFSDAFLGALVHDVNLVLRRCPGDVAT